MKTEIQKREYDDEFYVRTWLGQYVYKDDRIFYSSKSGQGNICLAVVVEIGKDYVKVQPLLDANQTRWSVRTEWYDKRTGETLTEQQALGSWSPKLALGAGRFSGGYEYPLGRENIATRRAPDGAPKIVKLTPGLPAFITITSAYGVNLEKALEE